MGRRPPRSKPLPDPVAELSRKRRASTAARGYDSHHEALRELLLAKHPICQMCRRAWSTDYHHTCGDSHCRDPEHALAICKRCHIETHAR